MVMMERLDTLREAIRRTAAENGARSIRVFGSLARGEDTPNSDVDFLVALQPGRTLFDLARLELRLEAMLGRRVDVVTEAALREPLRTAALREAVDV